MGPACALVEIKDGKVTCWSGTQKSHFVQAGVAATLGVPVGDVHVKWVTGPGSYGRNDADDAAMDAAVLAKAVGKPVRVQYMRNEGTGWDPKGPASIHRARAAIDAQGNVVAYEFTSKGFSRVDVDTNGSIPTTRSPAWRAASRSNPAMASACRRILRVPEQADRVGNHCAAARPLVAAALVALA